MKWKLVGHLESHLGKMMFGWGTHVKRCSAKENM